MSDKPVAPAPAAEQSDPQDLLKATRAALGRKDYRSATASVESFLAKVPGNPEAWLLLGQVHFECGSHADALAAYSKAMELNPGDYRVWFNIGELYSACEQHQDAHTAYTHALSLPGVDIDTLQQRLEATQANIRAQAVGENQQSAPTPAPPAAAAPAPASQPQPSPPVSRPTPTQPASAPSSSAAPPAAQSNNNGPIRPQPQPSTASSAPAPVPMGEDSAYTVVPPRLETGTYESARGESLFTTMGGTTVHNPKQALPPAKVAVTTGAGNMGKFTCLTAPLSTLQEHTVPSKLQQTPTLHELLQDIPHALQQAKVIEEKASELQVPNLLKGSIWLLPVSVLRLWFLLAISDHSRHTAHKLYPDQHPVPPGLPPIHYNLLSADGLSAAPQQGGVKRPRDNTDQSSGPAYSEGSAPGFSNGPNFSGNAQGDAGVTVSQARAMFGARFPNRMRGKKGIRLMGVPPPSKNSSTEQEDNQQLAAVHALASCLGASTVDPAFLNLACATLGAPKPTQAQTPAAGGALPQWAQTLAQNVQPTVNGVELRLMLNEKPDAGSSHRIVLRVPAWPHRRRVQRRETRLSRLLAAGAQDVQPEDEIGSVDTVIDENDERLVPVQPTHAASHPAMPTHSTAPQAPRGAPMPFHHQAPQQPQQPSAQHGWNSGAPHMEQMGMQANAPPPPVDTKGPPPGPPGAPQGMPTAGGVMSARDFMPPTSSAGMHMQQQHGMPRGSGGMDMHMMHGQPQQGGMHMGPEGMYGGPHGGMGHFAQQGGPPPGMHPGMGMPPSGYHEHGQPQGYLPAANGGHMQPQQGQHYGSPPPMVPVSGYHGADERAQQQAQHMRGPSGMPPQGYGMYPGQGQPMPGQDGGFGGYSAGMSAAYHGGHAPPPQQHGHPGGHQQHGYGVPPGGQQFYEHPGAAPQYPGHPGQGYAQGQPQGYGAPPPQYAGQFQYYR